jgi:hypothetical protein
MSRVQALALVVVGAAMEAGTSTIENLAADLARTRGDLETAQLHAVGVADMVERGLALLESVQARGRCPGCGARASQVCLSDCDFEDALTDLRVALRLAGRQR